DDRGELLSVAKELAQQENVPIFLTPNTKVPVSVMGQLESLGVASVTYVGTPLTSEVESQFQGLGVSVNRVTAEGEDQVEQEVRDRLVQQMNVSQRLNIVAATNFKYSIAAVNSINANSYVVGSEDQITGAVQAIQARNITQVRVVGNPDLAQQIATQVRNQTDADVTVAGIQASAAARFSANSAAADAEAYRKAHKRLAEKWKQDLQQKQQAMQERANASLKRAERLVENVNMSSELGDDLHEARVLYSAGKYLESLRASQDVIGKVKEGRWDKIQGNRSAIRDEVRAEVTGMEDQIEQLRELNQEFAGKMQQNMTVEERLKIIQEFKDERRGVVKDLVKNAKGLRGADDVREQLRERRDRFRDRDRTGRDLEQEIKTRCIDDLSPGQANVAVKGGDGYVQTRGKLGLSSPNYRGKVDYSVDPNASTVSFTVTYTKRDGVGIQCVGGSEFRARLEAKPGNWTVTTDVVVDGESVATTSRVVTVTRDREDGGDGRDREDGGDGRDREDNETRRGPAKITAENKTENETSDTEPAIAVVQEDDPDTTVTMQGTAFQSSPTVEAGSTVRFVNNDSFAHTVTIKEAGIDVNVGAGESVTLEFDEAGSYDIVCRLHSGMRTTVTVE
ncbi:MAG: cupredoxin domain-containing protein, partial [Candidatus Nanohaloarchaea archaeon]|nr:cupredoxin domain-containing protein [Candidatus Nanohaloarchaea archaeon]